MSTGGDTRREQVLAALVRAGSAVVSGQALAESLACSRAAIHRHVEALRRQGIEIDGVHEGYRLSSSADPIVASLVQERLAPPVAGPVRWSARTGSTNEDAAALARSGAPEGLVLGADFQDRGRGRRGREWHSSAGAGLLFSVILRPQVSAAEVGMVPILAAVAVAEALDIGAEIVWPNDVVVGERKVCGILCELAADEGGVAWIVVGIGINVRAAPVVTDGRWQAGAVSDTASATSRGDVLVAVLSALGRRYVEWRETGPASVLAAFAERDRLRGRAVTVQAGVRETTGIAGGLDEHGHLRVGDAALGAGEVTRISPA